MQKPGPTDTVPALITPGEFVLNLGAVEILGGGEVVAELNRLGLELMGKQKDKRNVLIPRKQRVQGFEDGTLSPAGVQPTPAPSAPANGGGNAVYKQGNSYTQTTNAGSPAMGLSRTSTPSLGSSTTPTSSSTPLFKQGNSYSQFNGEGATALRSAKSLASSSNSSSGQFVGGLRDTPIQVDTTIPSLGGGLSQRALFSARPQPEPFQKPVGWQDMDEGFHDNFQNKYLNDFG